MKYLFVKFFRDIRKLWPQFLSVLIMAMISTTIFTGMSAVWSGMRSVSEEYFDDCNLADAWVYGYGISGDDVAAIENLSYVKNAAASSAVKVTSELNGNSSSINLVTISDKSMSVLNPLVRSGSDVNPVEKGIWIDEDYAYMHSLKEGSVIQISYNDSTFNIEVRGTVLDAENIFYVQSAIDVLPDHAANGYAYISEDYAKELFGPLNYTQIRLSLSEDTDRETITEDASEILEKRFFCANKRENLATLWRISDDQAQTQKMAIMFSAVFIILSLLTMYTTMSRLVDNQVLQIGTFKALGYDNKRIYLHYGLYGFAVSIIGGLLGHIAGLLVVTPMVLNVKKTTLSLPEWNMGISTEAIIIWLIIIVICTGSALLTGRKIIRAVPAQTIKGVIEKKGLNTKKLKRSKLSYSKLWAVRSIRMHKARFAMGVIAAAGSVVLMTAGLGVWDSLVSSYDDLYENQYTYDYAATIKKDSEELIKNELENVQFSETASAEISFKDTTKTASICALSDGSYINFFENGTSVSLSKGDVFITSKLASQLGISSGDSVTVKESNSSEETTYEINKIINAKSPQGIFIFSEDRENFSPTEIYFSENELKAAQDSDFITEIISRTEQRSNSDTMLESVRSIMLILIFAAFLLSVVVLYNLGSLNFIERYGEYATMKVLGFYKKELREMVLTDGVITLVCGLIIGIPASFAFLNAYIGIISMDGMEWSPYIMPIKSVIVVLAVSVFSIAISLFIAHKIKSVDMVEAMKSAE